MRTHVDAKFTICGVAYGKHEQEYEEPYESVVVHIEFAPHQSLHCETRYVVMRKMI